MSEKITCPKCGSDQLTANKKGFSGTKAVAGAVLTGGIGLLAGTIGSNTIKITCMACGNQWAPKQLQQQRQQQLENKEVIELALWKQEFYRLYDAKQFDDAATHLLKNNKLHSVKPDIHQAYSHLKSSDSQLMWIVVFLVAVVGFIIYLIVK